MDPFRSFMSGTEIGGEEIGAVQARMPQAQVRQSSGQLQRVAAGIPRTSIATTVTSEVTIVTSEAFRPDRIILSTAAQALDVNNIRIGTKSLNVTSNPISGNCFSEQATYAELQGYTAQAGVGFTISFTNNTGATIVAGGGVFGPGLN